MVSKPPALLVSYYYLQPFLDAQPQYRYRDWVMDSGAYSAFNSGKPIELQRYIDKCIELLSRDQTLTEVFALDVIGDPDASRRNTEEMWRQGVPAIPCFHVGEPWDLLIDMVKRYPKVALGGMVPIGQAEKIGWLAGCFRRCWPARFHGFGVAGERLLNLFPFHSVDATNWEIAPVAFGNWKRFGKMSVRGSDQDLRSQVAYYLELEEKLRVRWAPQMAQLDALPTKWPQALAPSVRLVANGSGGRVEAKVEAKVEAFGGKPSVRLALEPGAAGGGRSKRALGAGLLKSEAGAAGEQAKQPEKDVAVEKPKTKTPEIDQKWAGNWWER